jgi:hypothetical protein
MVLISLRKYKIILYDMVLCLEVPPAPLAEWCAGGRPLGLPDSVAGDVNPRDGGHVCEVAARV